MKNGNLSEHTDKECFENGEIVGCLNQQTNVYLIKQGQLGKMDGCHNLNRKQLKD